MSKTKQTKNEQFRWNDDYVANLIKALASYKSQMEFKGLDFDTDRNKQYEEVRKIVATHYKDDAEVFHTKGYRQVYHGSTWRIRMFDSL